MYGSGEVRSAGESGGALWCSEAEWGATECRMVVLAMDYY